MLEKDTNVATSEVTTLKHELRDDTVEAGALVTLALGSSAELTEVGGRLGDFLLEEVEVDAARLGWKASMLAPIEKNRERRTGGGGGTRDGRRRSNPGGILYPSRPNPLET